MEVPNRRFPCLYSREAVEASRAKSAEEGLNSRLDRPKNRTSARPRNRNWAPNSGEGVSVLSNVKN
jgi:hypothetical protein